MTLYEFKILHKEKQADVTWKLGVLLAVRQGNHFTVALYQIEGFYVEIFYNTQENEISNIKSFLSTEPLTTYLDDMDISGLV